MRSHYKPEDFRREKRRVPDGLLLAFGTPVTVVVLAAGLVWLMVRVPNNSRLQFVTEPPIPSLSVEEQILGELVRGNVLLERLVKAVEAKPVATTNAPLKPDPKRGQEILASAGITDLGGIKLGGDSE